MGVLNVTPDSFSDGGRHSDEREMRARVSAMLEEGADVIDVGGESTRPGATPVDEAEQLRRVLPAVRFAAGDCRAVVSIDTTLPGVAAAAIDAGAAAVNDVSCLADITLADVARRGGASLIVMHSRGEMAKMPGFSTWPENGYRDVVAEVRAELVAARDRALASGLDSNELLVDPGLGFHKSAAQSYRLLARLDELADVAPIVVGASRKSFLARDASAPADARLAHSLAAAMLAAFAGAAMVRVHDVRETRQALAVLAATRAEAPR